MLIVSQVIPEKEIKPLTLRVQEGKCVLIGGVARVELLEVTRLCGGWMNTT